MVRSALGNEYHLLVHPWDLCWSPMKLPGIAVGPILVGGQVNFEVAFDLELEVLAHLVHGGELLGFLEELAVGVG